MAKLLAYDEEARQKLASGVTKLARAVRSTLGPRGRNAVIDKGWGSPTVTKDGVTVAEEIELTDPYENMGAQLVKEAASKTSDAAGDGVRDAAAEFAGRGACVLLADAARDAQAGDATLPALTAHPAIEPVLMVQSFYKLVNALSVARGFDPDAPSHLAKVTRTL